MKLIILLIMLLNFINANAQDKINNIIINKNTIPNPDVTMPGQAITVIGPDDNGNVDHVRITQYGFSVDPLFSCDFANGTASHPTIVQNHESLCTFQGRGCTLKEGCKFDGTGYGPSTVQFRIVSCQDWNKDGRCTRVQLSTTQYGTTNEYAKVNWSDGGHIEYGNSLPLIISGCGINSTIEGSDNAFRVIIGNNAMQNCRIKFNNSWVSPLKRTRYSPICTANNESSNYLVRAIAINSEELTISGKFIPNDRISVICVGMHDLP